MVCVPPVMSLYRSVKVAGVRSPFVMPRYPERKLLSVVRIRSAVNVPSNSAAAYI